jgi:hypothetical protein
VGVATPGFSFPSVEVGWARRFAPFPSWLDMQW